MLNSILAYVTFNIKALLKNKISFVWSIALPLVKYSLQGTTQGRYLTGGVPPVRFSM